MVPPGEVAKDLEQRGAWRWIPWNSAGYWEDEIPLEEVLDPGELGTLPDFPKLATTEQILSALTEKQRRLAKHLKYSAAAQFAYQTYATDVNASTINTPKALLGSENAGFVESFELQQVQAVPGFPELADDIKYLVNKALPGSQIEVTAEGTLIDKSTGFNMLLVQDKENPAELILAFGGTSGGAIGMFDIGEQIFQEQWKANIVQGVGGVPESTLQAVSAGEAIVYLLKHTGIEIVCAGHSKGGMEAIVAGLSLGMVVYADNPAPVVGARGLIEATASAWNVREGSHILQSSKRYVHTVSISIDPISHLLGPTREEFGIHDHIRLASTRPLGAHVNVWESLANWIINHPPMEIQQVRQRMKDEAELELHREVENDYAEAQKEELELQQEVQAVIDSIEADVPDELRRERKRDIFIKALSKNRDKKVDHPESLEATAKINRRADKKLLKLWNREERLKRQKHVT